MHKHYTVNMKATEVSNKEDKDEDEEKEQHFKIFKIRPLKFCLYSFAVTIILMSCNGHRDFAK